MDASHAVERERPSCEGYGEDLDAPVEEPRYLNSSLDSEHESVHREYRRRMDEAKAILNVARPLQERMSALEERLKQKAGGGRYVWTMGISALGGVLLHFALATSGLLEFTLGTAIVLLASIGLIARLAEVSATARQIEQTEQRLDELRCRWIANGGLDRQFWDYRWKDVWPGLTNTAKSTNGRRTFDDNWWAEVRQRLLEKARDSKK